jgi:hypothetical protein
MQSIKNGMSDIGINVNYNPSTEDQVGNVVWVVSDIPALRQAIELKKRKKIKYLLAGPNLMVRANDHNNVLAAREIDVCIVPSEWVKNAYLEDAPALDGRIRIWFAGVDTTFWSNASSKEDRMNNKKVLVYWKTESESFCLMVEKLLNQHGWIPVRMRYGQYNQHQYRSVLAQVSFSVFISRSESQGLALAEAWAMGVPTLVWDPQAPFVIQNKLHNPVDAAPYLTSATGLLWKDFDELNGLLNNIRQMMWLFNPSAWVIENMSNKKSAQAIVNIIKDL